MHSLLQAADRESIAARLGALTPQQERKWGRMTVGQMVCHISDQMRIAFGDIPTKDRANFFMQHVVKFLIIYLPLRMPRGGVPTVPEMQSSVPGGWETDLSACKQLVQRFGVDSPVAPHPVFGAMTAAEWGILAYKHLDHHLTQFGV